MIAVCKVCWWKQLLTGGRGIVKSNNVSFVGNIPVKRKAIHISGKETIK